MIHRPENTLIQGNVRSGYSLYLESAAATQTVSLGDLTDVVRIDFDFEMIHTGVLPQNPMLEPAAGLVVDSYGSGYRTTAGDWNAGTPTVAPVTVVRKNYGFMLGSQADTAAAVSGSGRGSIILGAAGYTYTCDVTMMSTTYDGAAAGWHFKGGMAVGDISTMTIKDITGSSIREGSWVRLYKIKAQ